MGRSRSDPALRTRREIFGRAEGQVGSAIPGYMGHVPGARLEDAAHGSTFHRSLEIARGLRSRPTFDAQAMRLHQEADMRRTRTTEEMVTAPPVDGRGLGYPSAGDFMHSRVRASNEAKDESHFHSSMGLTSLSHEDRGAAERTKGFGHAARGVPGYGGHVPGKVAENVFADTWSKSHENSLGAHFSARMAAPKRFGMLTKGGTMVATVPSDTLPESSIFNTSYHDRLRGWSTCQFSGTEVDPAGRLAPRDRQEAFGLHQPPIPNVRSHGLRGSAIHGYMGWVPSRQGESIVGERQCKTNAISDHLSRKNQLRITQR